MILLWGIVEDSPLASVRDALESLGARVVFLDQREALQTEIELTVDGCVSGVLRLPSGEVPLGEIRAVYVRPYDVRRTLSRNAGLSRNAAGPDHSRGDRAALFESTISWWTDIAPTLVINRPSAMRSNGSKPYQAAFIQSAGFDVPDTVVTTDKEAVTNFWERHGRIIYKSVSGIRSIVSQLTLEHRGRLDDLVNCPTQFQEYVEGTDVRIHVVADEVFSCEIESTADDYRYALRQGCKLQIRPYDLPAEVADRCRSLTATLNLPVAGIDLRRTHDERWCCFEVNPSPAFTFYESWTGQPIGGAIARLLAGADSD
jgi:hypothetical protein